MTDTIIKASRSVDRTADMFALIWPGAAAAVLSISAAVGTAVLGGGAPVVAFVASVALAGIMIGHRFRRQHDQRAANGARVLRLGVADELGQYKAFTRLLRDQGGRIAECTAEAAREVVTGLSEIEAAISRMRILVDRLASDDAPELQSLLEAAGAPVVAMLGHLQFQDVTQQQIAFLSRLSLLLDEHMMQLAAQLGDRLALVRIGRFKDMFDEALCDCVMDSQRNDHHAASGLVLQEDSGLKLEMF